MADEVVPPTYLNPDYVTSAHMEGGAWLVGLVFSSKEPGEGAMRAIIELYNKAAGLVEPPPQS